MHWVLDEEGGNVVMFNRIVVPLDGSDLSERVLPLARYLAKSLRSSVELLTVVSEESSGPGGAGGEQALLSSLALKASAFEALGVRASTKTLKGDPADRIIAEADSVPGTLIVMCTHGRSGMQRWVLGSVADRVAHYAASPLLIVNSLAATATRPEERLGAALVPLDGSPLAEEALPVARQLARTLSLPLVLLRSVPFPVIYAEMEDGIWPADFYQDVLDAGRNEALTYLSSVATAQKQAGVEKVNTVVTVGNAAGVIVDTAKSLPDAITIITSHGRSGLGRWLLGSVADHVIRTSVRPVLLLRAGRPTPI